MESYPGELLVGVFPLVFCVDSTLTKAQEERRGDSNGSAHSRSQFDRFLDAMAGSLMDDAEEDPLRGHDESPNRRARSSEDSTSNNVMMSLFRGDDYIDSDQEDEMILGTVDYVPTSSSSTAGHGTSSYHDGISFPDTDVRRKSSFGFRFGSKNQRSSSNSGTGLNTYFAQKIQEGQQFFQRARIVAIGSRHGFPPSKDPSGEKNRVQQYMLGKNFHNKQFLSATQKNPIDGILTSGWLEKHAAALPSVILVVVEVSQNQEQAAQDELMFRTLQSLQYSLASKRRCTIQIVAIVQDGVSSILVEQWSEAVGEKLGGIPHTVLQVKDLQQDAPPSIKLKHLHKTVRDASLTYYMAQARRTKQKLFNLGPARTSPLLLPLSIRYCFKAAMFYEFQWRTEKSLKYLVEAYRHVETYYRYLLQQREIGNIDDHHSDDAVKKIRVTKGSGAAAATEEHEGEGVELSLPSSEEEDMNLLLKASKPPDDMVLQCRAVADWLNFKILQFGFTCHTEGGLVAASSQWQKHGQAFCNPRRSFVRIAGHAYLDWSFVAHQRLVVSQLLERNPPKVLGNLGSDYDEILLRCSPWLTYQAAAEAFLRLGAEVKNAARNSSFDLSGANKVDKMRTRYVGGLDNEGYAPKLQDETKINHLEKGLDCVMRAISFYELDIQKALKDELQVPWIRSGARLYYLAGSTLLGLQRHPEAMPHLEKAANMAKGWSGLELVIQRMLIKSFEKFMTCQCIESSKTLASTLLDSYFNPDMSKFDIRPGLEKLSGFIGGDAIQWYRDCIDEGDSTLPFSFALTFPVTTHATAGDSVKASVLIKSNLNYPVQVTSIVLHSLAGQVMIPSADLLGAENTIEGKDRGVIIHERTEIHVSTLIKLPKDLKQMASDESGNAGEKDGNTGKVNLVKSARPRTGGMTAAAGARFVAEDISEDSESRGWKEHWSLRCLGGRPVRCDGLKMVFSPVYSAETSEEKNAVIELTIEKKKPITETKVKRTPFEEDNYLSSAWMRPIYLPMNRGPSCLRVLPPIADMVVTNLTESCTNGKVLEGTVNRILLKLTAGAHENCSDIKFRVTCSNLLISAEGKTKKISRQTSDIEDENDLIDILNPHVRTPVLLKRNENAKSWSTEFGYQIPDGWALLGDGQGVDDEYTSVVSTLDSGESAYAYFDVFRPSPDATRMDGVVHAREDEEELEFEKQMCQTDINISICYRQKRTARKERVIRTRKQGRKKSDDESLSSTDVDYVESDLVYMDHTTSVLWSSPISAVFSPGLKSAHPSGNRHPSNTALDHLGKLSLSAAEQQSELVLIDGERVSTKCSLEAVASRDGLMANIEEIRFETANDDNSPCTFKLLSGKNENGLLYRAKSEDPCRKLVIGSRFSLAWIAEVNMKSNYLKGSVSASLGVLSIDWIPSEVKLPEEVIETGWAYSIGAHGPLILTRPSTCPFMGPPCYIENAPFEATMDKLPDSIKVATPFDLTYHIKNKTSLDQKLTVVLKDGDPGSDEAHGVLVSGLTNGELSLGPFESHTLSYTGLATRVGNIWMPQICVSSVRYKTWVIQEAQGPRRFLFVVP